jgi:hypothetical protein
MAVRSGPATVPPCHLTHHIVLAILGTAPPADRKPAKSLSLDGALRIAWRCFWLSFYRQLSPKWPSVSQPPPLDLASLGAGQPTFSSLVLRRQESRLFLADVGKKLAMSLHQITPSCFP